MIEWKPIGTAPVNTFVLVACRSGYTTLDWTFTTAEFTTGYHERWDDEAHDALADSGYVPEYWCDLPGNPDEVN